MADNEVKPGDDSSLDQFEQNLIEQEKKKARKNLTTSIVVLLLVAVVGFVVYGKIAGKDNVSAPPPPPPIPKVAAPKPEPAPTPEAKTEAPAPGAAKKDQKAPAKAAGPAPVDKKAEKAPAKAAAPAKAPEKPKAEAAKKETPPKTAITPTEKATATSGGFTIQLGVFAEQANVKKLTDQLAKLGLTPELGKRGVNVKSIVVTTNKYRYRELADADSKKLEADGYKNSVKLAGPGSYAIVVGRYSSEKEADAVVKKLEEKGYHVHVDFTAVKTEATVVLLTGIPDSAKLAETAELLKKEKIDFLVVKQSAPKAE